MTNEGTLPLTDAEFRITRERLGLSHEWLAGHFGVNERTIRKWEAGVTAIPGGRVLELLMLEEVADDLVDEAVETLEAAAPEDRTLIAYRSDADYHAAHPGFGYPVGWHRAILGRVREVVDGVEIVYAPSE
jgi:transcriptional regulator with XRE-family HTH domain